MCNATSIHLPDHSTKIISGTIFISLKPSNNRPVVKRKYTYPVLLSLLFTLANALPRKGPKEALEGLANKPPFDAIIVPGTPYNGNNWDSVMKARVLWSYILYRGGYTLNIIYSGGAVYSPWKESKIMGLFGEALGIPSRNIFCDTLAQHSTENVYYSYLLARKLGFKHIALATDPFQSWMLRSFTRKRFCSPIDHLPIIKDSLKAYQNLNPKVNAASARVENWSSIKDQQTFYKRFLGTLGKNIDWKKHRNGKVESL